MNVRERVLAIRLLEKTVKNPDYAKELGIKAVMKKGKWGDEETR